MRDDYTCAVCGLREPEIMHVDHTLPRYVAGDGYDRLENLVTLCPNDHARKTVADRKRYGHPAWNRGRKLTVEQKATINTSGLAIGRSWALGKKFSADHCRKLSESHKTQKGHWAGKKFSAEHRRKLSESHRGKKPWNVGRKAIADAA